VVDVFIGSPAAREDGGLHLQNATRLDEIADFFLRQRQAAGAAGLSRGRRFTAL